MHMSLVPQDTQAFAPLDGVNSQYRQLYRPVNSEAYTLGGINGFLPHNPFKNFKLCRDAMRMTTALIIQSCPSIVSFPVIPCLAKLNKWLLADKGDAWTEEKLAATMFPPIPSCLNVQAMATMKPKPGKRPTINELHAKLINGHDNIFFVAFER